jgi:hypothetical protein
LYSLPSIVRITKSRRMRWAGHVAQKGEKRNSYRLLVGKPEVGGWIILGWILEWWDGVIWDDLGWIGLAEDRNRWRALVNSVLNLRVP